MLQGVQRTAATHVFVFMLSTESRSRKPYSLPVQCLPIRGLRDRTVSDLLNKIILCMKERNMNVAGMCIISNIHVNIFIIIIIGFTSNGEFNSLRWKGNTRPLTVLQVRSEARSKYQNKGVRTLLDMLTPQG